MKPEGYLLVHKKPTLVPILSQINPVHILLPYFSDILFNVDLPIYTWFPNRYKLGAISTYISPQKLGAENNSKRVFHCWAYA
jgi:hypothetical protein